MDLIGRISALMRAADNGKGINMSELARRSGLGINTVRKILREGAEPKLPTLVKLASGLGMSVDELSSEREDIKVYTLADCPICQGVTYQLNLSSVMLPGVFASQCECGVEVAPWDDEAKAQAGWAVFRREGETNAITAKVWPLGDELLLFPAHLPIGSAQSPEQQLVDGQNGQILGAIFDLIWTDAFRR